MAGDREYARTVLRRSAAQVCQAIGWHGIHHQALEVMLHCLERFLLRLCEQTREYAERDARAEPLLADLSLAFTDMRVGLPELRDYLDQVPGARPRLDPPPFPLPRPPRLNFLKPGSREVLTRPVHVPEYLPPIVPETAENGERPGEAEPPPDSGGSEMPPPEIVDRFERPAEPPSPRAKPKTRLDELGGREITSVMMTMSGFLSPAREGRLPEARTPLVADASPERRQRPPPFGHRPEGPRPPAPRPDEGRPAKKPKFVDGPKKKARSRRESSKKKADVPADRLAAHLARGKAGPSAPAPIRIPPVPIAIPTRPPPETPPSLDLIPPKMIKREIEEPEPAPFSSPTECFAPAPIDFPFRIPKEEPPDEKLTSMPDRSKLTIFKKISTKNREERPIGEDVLRDAGFGSPVERARLADLSDGRRPFAEAPTGAPVVGEKKERKRKERKPKAERELAKAERELAKATKRRRKEEAIKLAAAAIEPVANPTSGFPPYPPMIPGPGLIPTPGLIPSGGLFPGLPGDPLLRKMIGGNGPNLLPNPFSASPMDPSGARFLPTAPGLIPPTVVDPAMNSIDDAFGPRPPLRFPDLAARLRRPSLEVIPIEEAEPRPVESLSVTPRLVIEERDRFGPIPADVANDLSECDGRSKSSKSSRMMDVTPDITIEVNPPNRIERAESDAGPRISNDLVGEKSEKKKDKLHKKEKKERDKDREQKIKKKKDKKEKLRIKLEKKKDKEERHDMKEKLKKEKKEKKKEKQRILSATEGIVPKLTLKLGSSSPIVQSSPENTPKLNIKPIIKKEISPVPEETASEEMIDVERSGSPELARISALVTRPPKMRSFMKTHIKSEFPESNSEMSTSPQNEASNSHKHSPQSSKFKRIFFKPMPKRNSDYDEPIGDADAGVAIPPVATVPTIPPGIPLGTPFYMDPHGNKIWICPACGHPDNGSPMIGCDGCDGWYHWICVGIHVAPDDSEDWYCTSCVAKRTAMVSALAGAPTGKKRGRKPKAEKLKEVQ